MFACLCRGLPILLLMVALAAALPAQDDPSSRLVQSDPSLSWSADRNAVTARAGQSGRPMLLYVFSPSAFACGEMETKTFRNAGVVEEMKQFELAAANILEDREITRSLQIIKVPTVIFYDPKGTELFRAVGYKRHQDFVDYLKAIPKPKPGERAGALKAQYDPSLVILQNRPGTTHQRFMTYQPQALVVTLRGEFNDWKDSNLPMNRDETGWWYIDLYLPDGFYDYVFNVDGKAVRDDRAEYRAFRRELNAYASSRLVGPLPGPKQTSEGVTFLYYNRLVKKVSIVGVFTGRKLVPMFSKGDGYWGITLKLNPGKHEYWFVPWDGTGREDLVKWQTDEQNPVVGPLGGSLVVVK
jgi:hypothetical protein